MIITKQQINPLQTALLLQEDVFQDSKIKVVKVPSNHKYPSLSARQSRCETKSSLF